MRDRGLSRGRRLISAIHCATRLPLRMKLKCRQGELRDAFCFEASAPRTPGGRLRSCPPKRGCAPFLLLDFAPPATRCPRRDRLFARGELHRRWLIRTVGRSAERSQGGAGGRRPTAGDMSAAECPAGLITPHTEAPGERPPSCWLEKGARASFILKDRRGQRRRLRCHPNWRRALSNIRIHGLGSPRSPEVQLICTFRKTRSGCGMRAVVRPSAVVTPVSPPGLPFGLAG